MTIFFSIKYLLLCLFSFINGVEILAFILEYLYQSVHLGRFKWTQKKIYPNACLPCKNFKFNIEEVPEMMVTEWKVFFKQY